MMMSLGRAETDQLRKLAARWRARARHPQRRNRPDAREALDDCADQLLDWLHGRAEASYDPLDPPRSAAMSLIRKTRSQLIGMYAGAAPEMALRAQHMTNEQIAAALLDMHIG